MNMKANEKENKDFSNALDTIIELFNNLEDDEPLIEFGQDVIEDIERAKKMYGQNIINERINNVVREILSLLTLDEVNKKDSTDEESEEAEEEKE